MEKSPKKWSLGNILFRKSKKDIPQADFSSDEDDRKAGFGNDFIKKSPSKHKTNKQLVQGFDQQQYSVANPEFHYYKPSQQQQQQNPQLYYNNGSSQQFLRPQIYQNNMEYINNQINLEKNRVAQPQYIYNNNTTYLQYQGSSQDEKSSYNSLSSPINKSGSENGSRTSLNKKTRSARNERYYQRMMREDGRAVTVYGSVNSMENNNNNSSNQNYQMPLLLNGSHNRLSASINSSSICSSDFMVNPLTQSNSLPIAAQRFRGKIDDDRDDYENIHEMDESVPPPIPPRDPNRRFSINTSISQNPYYFDQALQKYVIFNANGKCFSDDKLCKADERPKSARTDKLVDMKNSTKQHDILRPRSRKPLNVHTNLDNESVFSSEDVVDNPRQYPISQRSKSAIDFEKMMNSDPLRSKYAQRQRNLTSVEPIRYQVLLQQQQQQRDQQERIDELQALRKKYSSAEDVNRNKVNMRPKLPTANILPGTRKSLNEMDLKVKEGNVSSSLDDAINELELMYKSLVKDEDLMERASRRDLPTPTKFSQLMRKYEEYENEENRNDKEPDVVLDDVFSRNLKYANQRHRVTETQPPFGIPNQRLCPIPPKPAQDYLSVEPVQTRKSAQNNPDLVTDDLAVRNLRKDNPNYSRRRNLIEIDNNHFMKRNHTLSSLSDSIYNGILKDSAKPSGGNLADYLNFEASVAKTNSDNKSKDVKSPANNKSSSQKKCVDTAERANFEESLNALVIESKAISQKLEKDLSKLKRESVTPKSTTVSTVASSPSHPPKTLVNLLDFRKSMEKEKEKKSTSCSPVKIVGEETKPKMTSTACSPITDFDICPPKEEIIKEQAPKQHKTEKIENLIKMFNTTMSPEPVRKGLPAKVPIEKPSRKLSDVSKMFEKATEVDTKPPTQPTSSHTAHAVVKKTSSEEKVVPKMIQPRMVSPTVMHPPSKITSTSKVMLATPPPSPKATTKVMSPTLSENKPDVESNINNIKELIQQIKLTEFEKNKRDAMKPDILKSAQSDSLLPDYDNIKDDYEMTDGGKLERTTKIVATTISSKPDFLPSQEPLLKVQIPKESNSELDEASPEVKSITTTSSSLRETSVESSSKDSFSQCSEHVNDNSAAIYKDALDFLQETADPKAMALSENDHKSPIKSIHQDKEVVLNYIDKMSENLEAVKMNSDEIPKMSVKESVCKLEQKLSLSRQNSEPISEVASDYGTPVKQPSPPVQIKPVILPKVGPSDTESLYNSSEELAEIFGNAEQREQNVPMHPGKIIEEDFEAEFEKIAHDDEIIDDKLLDENFNVTLIDINNNSDFADCFDNELSDLTNESAMSTASALSSADVAGCSKSDNNNNLTNDLSKLTTPSTDCLITNRKPSTSNSNKHSSNSLKSSSAGSKSDSNSSQLQQQPLKTQCILLACLYCVMLYMQFIIYNFKSNN